MQELIKLIGTVGGREVVMSLETMKSVAPFDSRLAREYVYPDINHIIIDESTDPAWIGNKKYSGPKEGVMTQTCMKGAPQINSPDYVSQCHPHTW